MEMRRIFLMNFNIYLKKYALEKIRHSQGFHEGMETGEYIRTISLSETLAFFFSFLAQLVIIKKILGSFLRIFETLILENFSEF